MISVGQPSSIPMQPMASTRRVASRRFGPTRHTERIFPMPHVGCAEFPPPRFPSGVGVPPLALLGTLLMASVGLATIRTEQPVVILGGPPGWPGFVPAAAVALTAIWASLTLRITIVGPVRRLRNTVLEGPCGRQIRRSLVRDVDRIAVGVREIGGPAPGRASRRDRWPRLSIVAVLVLVAVVVLGSLGLSYVVLSRTGVLNAEVLAVETAQDTTRAADRLRSALLVGLSTLQGVAGPAAGGGDITATASMVLANRPVFRAVYVLDPSGRQVAAVGSPHGRPTPVLPPAGIGQLNTSGSAPLIVAVAPLYDGNSLVGEYDPRALNDVLRKSGARMRVVDAGMRTVLSNHGYQAFSELRDPELRAAAAIPAARPVPVAVVRTIAGAESTVVAQRIGEDGDPLAALGWVLVAHEDLSAAEFAHDPVSRGAAVVTGLGAGMTLALLGWVYVATVRPLRRAAAHAVAIGTAQSGTAPATPAPAQRIDEIGAIVTGLNRHLHSVSATRHLHSVSATPPTLQLSLPPSTTPIAALRPAARTPRTTPTTGPRPRVEHGSASWQVHERARVRDRAARDNTAVLAGR
jgi:hypothetical protein